MKKAAAISMVIVTLTLCFAFLVHLVRREAGQTAQGGVELLSKTAHSALELCKQVLNITPEVTITTYVTHQETKDIFELAAVSKDFPVEYHYQNKQFYSTKTLDLLGQYTVKAGFDLRDRFTIQIDQATHRIHADFPAAKILSVEQKNLKFVHEEDGYWNGVTKEDREKAVNDMNQMARARALELHACEEAKASLRRQLLELAKKSGQEWDIRFRDEVQLVPRTEER